MVWRRLVKPAPARLAGEALYARMVAQARDPALYLDLGAPDTPDGRFELYTLHVLLLLLRLQGEGRGAVAVSQALFDAYISGLDNGLRELAVGDLTVGKTMRRLGEAFYGRRQALASALAALPDRAPLEALVARTVFDGREGCGSDRLATYLIGLRERLTAAPLDDVIEGRWNEGVCR